MNDYPPVLILYFDGACEPKNPGGVSTYGWALADPTTEYFGMIYEEHGVASKGGPGSTNNFAEYCALGFALKHLKDNGWRGELLIRGDSALVCSQLDGSWQCNAAHLVKLRDRCRTLLKEIATKWSCEWIGRDKNKHCDTLSRQAYEAHTGKKFPERRKKVKK